ncbi:MAG: hypothetical protein ACC683_13150 [Acidimicrobiia bacterium]
MSHPNKIPWPIARAALVELARGARVVAAARVLTIEAAKKR